MSKLPRNTTLRRHFPSTLSPSSKKHLAKRSNSKESLGDQSANSQNSLSNVLPKKGSPQNTENELNKRQDNQFSLININQVHTYTLGRCGYCQNTKWMTSGFDCTKMDLKDYQLLMDRGWRRCGTYYYKPHVDFCCCRTFAIRISAFDYKQNSSQKKVMKKFDKMLELPNEKIHSGSNLAHQIPQNIEDEEEDEDDEEGEEEELLCRDTSPVRSFSLTTGSTEGLSKSMIGSSILEQKKNSLQSVASQMDEDLIKDIESLWKESLFECSNHIEENIRVLLDLVALPEKESELIKINLLSEESRLYKNKNMIKHGTHTSNLFIMIYSRNISIWAPAFKTRDKFFMQTHDFFKASLKKMNDVMAVKNKDIILKLGQCGEINLLYQKRSLLKRMTKNEKSGYNSLLNKKSLNQQSNQMTSSFQQQIAKKRIVPEIRRNFERKVFRTDFDEESFRLYKRYNEVIHNNMKTSKESYKNFLCVNGLRSSSQNNGKGKVLDQGCFHFRYYMDGVLIAVSVVDILLEGLSNVYYFYEPSLKKYSLGVTGNIRDIEYIKDMQQHFPNFRYYYLGYYIHNNSKMSYKAQYKPFELLCPITYKWVTFNKVTQDSIHEGEIPKLSSQEIIEDMDFSSVDIEKYVMQKVKLYISGRYIKINQIKQSFSTYFQYLLQKLVTLLGKQLSESLVFGQQ